MRLVLRYGKVCQVEKFWKILTILGCIISLSVLANIRDYSLSNSEQTFLDLNQFEHGAGGSLGAFIGLPFSV